MKPAFIRSAQRADLPVLRLVELAAADRFTESDLPPSLQRQTLDPDELQDALDQGLLWVVECQKELVGFLAARVEDCCVHVLEMSVIPSHGRQGLGTSLLDAAAREARRRSLSGVTLTTFSHIAWNGPAYLKAGFRVLEESSLTPALRRRLEGERGLGLSNRIAMHRNAVSVQPSHLADD